MWRWQNLFFATCQKAPWAWRADIICCKIMCLSNTVSQRHNQFFFSAHFRYRHLMLMAPKYPHNCRYVSPVLRHFFFCIFIFKAVAANLLPDFRSVCIWNAQHTAATFFWLRNIMLDESLGPNPFWNCSSTFAYFHDIFIYSYNIDMLQLILLLRLPPAPSMFYAVFAHFIIIDWLLVLLPTYLFNSMQSNKCSAEDLTYE